MKRRSVLAAATAWLLLAWADSSALLAAAEAGDMGTLRRLLDAGTPVDSRDARRRTPLLAATPPRSLEHLAMITLVLRTVVLRVRFATAGNTAVLALAGRTRACVNALRWP